MQLIDWNIILIFQKYFNYNGARRLHLYYTNKHRNVLYIGVTSDLQNRIWEHKNHLHKSSFSDQYNLEYLIYYEGFDDIEEAIQREKQLKNWSRKKKEFLINKLNPDWKDLYDEIMQW